MQIMNFIKSNLLLRNWCQRFVFLRSSHRIEDDQEGVLMIKIKDILYAKVIYKVEGDVYNLTYVYVPREVQGQGIGTIIAKETFEYLAKNKLKAQVSCSFLKDFLITNGNPFKMDEDIKSKIFHFCREKLYNHMLMACQDGIKNYPEEKSFNLYNALALILCHRSEESLQELQELRNLIDYRLSSIIALLFSHKKLETKDEGVFTDLETEVKQNKERATPTDFYHTAFILFAFGKYEKAYEYLEKALAGEPLQSDFLSLKGWTELFMLKFNLIQNTNITQTFEAVLEHNKRHLDTSLGLAECLNLDKQFDEAITVLNKAIVRFPSLNLALVQKMKHNFSRPNWDQTYEILNRILLLEPNNLEALKIHILILICYNANYEEAANLIESFHEKFLKTEPNNFDMLVEMSRLFSRVCGRNLLVLQQTSKMIESALEVSLNNTIYMLELAYQCVLQNRFKEATRIYKSIAKQADSENDSLLGLIFCELSESGKADQIKTQVQYLSDLKNLRGAPLLLFLQAKIAEKPESSLKFLNELSEKYLSAVSNVPFGSDYLLRLDPDFLLRICKEYLYYIPQAPILMAKEKYVQSPIVIAKKVEVILKIIVKACPGLQEALYLLSKLEFLNGDTAKAKEHLEQILTKEDISFADAHLLMAQMQLYMGEYERSAQSLEMGLSNDFKVRDNPLYHFIMGMIEKFKGNYDEATKCFTTALHLADLNNLELSLSDKASIYIELINGHLHANKIHEAAKLLEIAGREFHGTSEEARIMIINAEQAITKNEIQEAINILSSIGPEEPHYLQAKTKLANIFLQYRKDIKAYLNCYEEMVETNPNAESHLLLGDAYLNILEIEKALESYENAVQTNPKDPYLNSKMGKALVQTHYYKRAVSYYKDAIKLTESPELKIELVELYVQLKQFDKAEMLLIAEIEQENVKKEEDLSTLKYKTQLLSILSKLYERNNNTTGARKMLKDAKENQIRLVKRYEIEDKDNPKEELEIFKNICIKLADLSKTLKDNEGAISYYREALEEFPNDPVVLTNLAKLHMQMGNLEKCQQTCANLLNVDPDNEDASVMMANISFRKVDFNMASFHFTQLLSKEPTNWKTLERFIQVMRRTGELDEVPQYLKQAELSCGSTIKVGGFCYCTALYQWYSGNLNGALRNFNNIRLDPEWGKKAICNMIEICLNPEDEMLGEQFFDNDDSEYRDSRTMALNTADRLLRDLKQKSSGLEEDNFRYRLLGNFLLLATKEKMNIELALEDFTVIASLDAYREEIGPILGMATAHTMLKQGQRAKNQLKRIVKSMWTFEDAEYLERCWLLLADYYIQSSKYDLASELLKKILTHNKTCTKAYEFSGIISEKEQNYKEASLHYDCAWKFGGRNNPAIGYKLAFNFMKCKKYADAIDVCQQVLRNHPDYPRIKKDILDKSINNLRT